jgi:hypothetical protein
MRLMSRLNGKAAIQLDVSKITDGDVEMFAKKCSLLLGMFAVVIMLSFLIIRPVHAAPIDHFPVTVTQPDGTKLDLFASGDEYYNWLQDAQGFTVIQDPVTGYYVYADLVSGKLVPTNFVTGRVNPASAGLRPYLNISATNVLANQTAQNYIATGPTNLLQDPSFEAYTPNPYWMETSTHYDTPLCSTMDPPCLLGGGTAGPRTGSVWGWFGGTPLDETATLSQTVIIPSGSARLEFYLWIGAVDAGSDAADVFTASIDGVTVFSVNATQISSYPNYTLVSVEVSAYANGASHTVMFSSVTTGQTVTFNLDDVALNVTLHRIYLPLVMR